MTDENINDKSIFKKVVTEENPSGEMKMQFTVDLTPYDTSKMEGYKQGDRVYKGHSCKLATLKPNKTYPRSRIDIDPSNQEIRKAIFDMYSRYDALLKK